MERRSAMIFLHSDSASACYISAQLCFATAKCAPGGLFRMPQKHHSVHEDNAYISTLSMLDCLLSVGWWWESLRKHGQPHGKHEEGSATSPS